MVRNPSFALCRFYYISYIIHFAKYYRKVTPKSIIYLDPKFLIPITLYFPDLDPEDPYLLSGSEAIAAVTRAKNHGELYFHDIPHIESLLANQQLRIKNNLKPHTLGSIRHTWPYYRI